MKHSNRVDAIQYSPIRKLVPLAEAAKKQGKKIYHLNIGQPDIETPQEFFDAVKNFNKSVLEYSFSQGIPELIDSFIAYYKRHDINYEVDEILITNGGSEALLFSLLATCEYGDDILIPEPFYTNYNMFAKMAGVNIIPVVTKASEGFKLPELSEIEKKLTDKTKVILLSNPGNPTGAVYSEADVKKVAELAIKHNLFIVADEVYREFVYDGKFVSFASISGIEDRLILTDSISKRYSACGARIGSIASKNKTLIAQMLKLCQSRLCVSTLDQVGAAKLIEVSPKYLENVTIEYKNRRDLVFEALKKMDGVVCEKPMGAFYVIAKLPVENSEDFAKWLLTDFEVNGETVMVAPANGFYATKGLGNDEIRISYVLNTDDLAKAMNIIELGIKKYKASM